MSDEHEDEYYPEFLAWLDRCRRRLLVAEQGQLRPGHIRARKPTR